MLRPTKLAPENQLVRDEGSVVTVTPPSDLTDVALASILRALEVRLASNSHYVLVFDLSSAGIPNAVQRQALAAHMKKNKELIRRSVHALGVAVPSPAARGMLTAIFWIEPPPVPYKIFGTATDATIWARTQTRSMRAQ